MYLAFLIVSFPCTSFYNFAFSLFIEVILCFVIFHIMESLQLSFILGVQKLLPSVPIKDEKDPCEPVNTLLSSLFRYKTEEDRQILSKLKKKVIVKYKSLFKDVSVTMKYYYQVVDGCSVHTIHFEKDDLISLDELSTTIPKRDTSKHQDGTSLVPHIPGTAGNASSSKHASASGVTNQASASSTANPHARTLTLGQTCKVCMDSQVCITFVPCGHLATCLACSTALKDCPVCRRPIEGTIGTFY